MVLAAGLALRENRALDLKAPQPIIDERQLLYERRAPLSELAEERVGVQSRCRHPNEPIHVGCGLVVGERLTRGAQGNALKTLVPSIRGAAGTTIQDTRCGR